LSGGLLLDVCSRHQAPRQQLVDAVDGMIGDALKHRAQIGKRLNADQARRTDQAIDYRRALATAVGACEQIIATLMLRSA